MHPPARDACGGWLLVPSRAKHPEPGVHQSRSKTLPSNCRRLACWGGSCEEDRRERLWLGHGRAPAPRCNETAQPSPIHWGLRSGPRSLATAKQEETEEEGRDKVVREFDHLA